MKNRLKLEKQTRTKRVKEQNSLIKKRKRIKTYQYNKLSEDQVNRIYEILTEEE